MYTRHPLNGNGLVEDITRQIPVKLLLLAVDRLQVRGVKSGLNRFQ